MCNNDAKAKTEEELYEEYYEKYYDELYEEAQAAFYESGAYYEYLDEEQWLEDWIEVRIKNLIKEGLVK